MELAEEFQMSDCQQSICERLQKKSKTLPPTVSKYVFVPGRPGDTVDEDIAASSCISPGNILPRYTPPSDPTPTVAGICESRRLTTMIVFLVKSGQVV